ncbi:MAG: hypothetical protein ISP42_02960 [Alphaproteobacteria bacterium]|jgi:protein-tyrosine-phosphatase|nr:hypothetical protein [Alphaproteobacteria bacterium]
MARNVLDRLALRQKLEMLRQAGNIRTVAAERARTLKMTEQLSEMAEEIRIETGETTARQLRSASWYGTRLAEQIKTAESRCHFLEQEIDSCRSQMAHALHRKNQTEEKNRQLQKQQAEEKLLKQEADLPPRRSRH